VGRNLAVLNPDFTGSPKGSEALGAEPEIIWS